MIYDYKHLNKLYDKYKAERPGGIKDSLMAVAAGYAMDFIDLARDNRIVLTLTSASEENVPQAMVLAHFNNVKRGLTENECRMDLVKKLAAYELFAIYNSLVSAGDKNACIDVVFNDLVIKTKAGDGSALTFNVYAKIREALKGFQLTTDSNNPVLMGTLQPFYQSLEKDLILKL